MNKSIIILFAALLLTGCNRELLGDLPTTQSVQVPDLPVKLSERATALPPIIDNTMGGRELDAAETDRKYNKVAHQTNDLIKLYNCVKDSINNKKDIKKCLKD